MGKRGLEFRVGIFVILALLLLISGFFWLGEFRAGRAGYGVKVLFTDVGGLRAGDPVHIAGVEKGKVLKIELKKHVVEVDLWLDSDVQLSSDCRVLIRDIAMISGTKFVKIEPGKSEAPLDLSKPVWGVTPPDFSLSDLQLVAGHMSGILDRLANHLVTEETAKSLKETIQNTNRLTRDLSKMTSQSRTHIVQGLKDLRSASEKLNELISSEEFNATLASLRVISESLEKVSQGKGTLGKLMTDEELYGELRETTGALRELVEDIRANPKRYVKFSIF